MKTIKYASQNINQLDINHVKKSLKGDFITQGKTSEIFEKNLKKKFNSKYALAVSSGTSALKIAIMSLNLTKNDGIIVPSITFVATINAAKNITNKIIISDVDPSYGCITKEKLLDAIKIAKKKKINVKCLLNVFYAGQTKDVYEIYKICKKNNISIVEDSCHAIGTKYKVQNKLYNVGSCSHSKISTFSFHSIKNITTGEGGAILTNNFEIYKKSKVLRSHGILRNLNKEKPWEYDAKFFSENYRVTDFQCALGISQLKKIEIFKKKKKYLYNYYLKKINDFKEYFTELKNEKNCSDPHWHLFPIIFNKKNIQYRNKLYFFLKSKDIFTQIHYIPLYKHTLYKSLYLKNFHKDSEFFYRRVLSLPFHTQLTKLQIDRVIKNINIFFNKIAQNKV
jgi:dTDP-4-amino-4,6-dideoxygalactose transaminase